MTYATTLHRIINQADYDDKRIMFSGNEEREPLNDLNRRLSPVK